MSFLFSLIIAIHEISSYDKCSNGEWREVRIIETMEEFNLLSKEEKTQILDGAIKHFEYNEKHRNKEMSKKEDMQLAEMYGERVGKVEKGESKAYEIKNVEELFKMIED